MNPERVDIGILTVIPVELWAVIDTLGLDHRYKAAGTVYRTGTIASRFGRTYTVAVMCIGEAGNPSATAATHDMIATLTPRCILLMGIAAGIRGKIKIGQVVFAERVVAYESGAAEDDERGNASFRHRPDTNRPSHALWQDVVNYRPDADRIRARFEDANGRIPDPANGQEDAFDAYVVRSLSSSLATVASGETLFKSRSLLAKLRDVHGKIEAADMEGAGFFEGCRRSNTPCLVIRGISDFGDEFKDDRFHEFASRAAAAVMADFIANGLDLADGAPALDGKQVTRELPPSLRPRPRGPIGAPIVPPHFRPRRHEFEALKRCLLAERPGSAENGSGRVGILGMPGSGKTVLAADLARDSAVQQAYPDGVHWITVGRSPTIADLQNELLHQMTGAVPVAASEVKNALRSAIGTACPLIVLDDVWESEHAYAFCESCGPARLLVTTRNAPVLLGIGAARYPVDRLNPEDAIALLADWAGTQPTDLPVEAPAIAERCGYLPLALAAVGATVRDGPHAWSDALARLRRAGLTDVGQPSADYAYRDLDRALDVSIDALAVPDRERYLDLAVFPEDQSIPEDVLAQLWETDELTARTCMQRFAERSLVSKATAQGREAIMLHDLYRDLIRKRRAAELPELHARLLRAWSHEPHATGSYAWRWTNYHRARAGWLGRLLNERSAASGGATTASNAVAEERDYLAAGALLWEQAETSQDRPAARFLARVAATATVHHDVGVWEQRLTEPLLNEPERNVLALAPGQMTPGEGEQVLRALVARDGERTPERRRAEIHLAAQAVVRVGGLPNAAIVAVADGCLSVAGRHDCASGSELTKAVRTFPRNAAFAPAFDTLARFVARGPSGPQRDAALEWAAEALLDGWVKERALPGDLSLAERDWVAILAESNHLNELFAPLGGTDTDAKVKAVLRLVEIGFRSRVGVLAGLPESTATRLAAAVFDAALAPAPEARVSATALAWLAKARLLNAPRANLDPELIAALAAGVTASSTADEARGLLALTLAKLTTAPEDPWDQALRWAKMADFDLPLEPAVSRAHPDETMLSVIDYAENRLAQAVHSGNTVDDRNALWLALALGRFGIVTTASAALTARALLGELPDSNVTQEAIMHLGRAGTPSAEEALLRIYAESTRVAEREWCFLALVGNGSPAAWRIMREGGSSPSDRERKTLDVLLSPAKTHQRPAQGIVIRLARWLLRR